MSDEDNEIAEGIADSSRFCTAVEQAAVIADRRVVSARAKALALSLFEKIDEDTPRTVDSTEDSTSIDSIDNQEPTSDYRYFATVTNPLLFELAVRFTSSGSSFRMTTNNMRHTTEQVFALSMRALHRNEISHMMRVACAANL